MSTQLPPIPAKRYFTIGEVADLCGVKPHVLRYWEQEFTQLRPVKRRGNRGRGGVRSLRCRQNGFQLLTQGGVQLPGFSKNNIEFFNIMVFQRCIALRKIIDTALNKADKIAQTIVGIRFRKKGRARIRRKSPFYFKIHQTDRIAKLKILSYLLDVTALSNSRSRPEGQHSNHTENHDTCSDHEIFLAVSMWNNKIFGSFAGSLLRQPPRLHQTTRNYNFHGIFDIHVSVNYLLFADDKQETGSRIGRSRNEHGNHIVVEAVRTGLKHEISGNEAKHPAVFFWIFEHHDPFKLASSITHDNIGNLLDTVIQRPDARDLFKRIVNTRDQSLAKIILRNHTNRDTYQRSQNQPHSGNAITYCPTDRHAKKTVGYLKKGVHDVDCYNKRYKHQHTRDQILSHLTEQVVKPLTGIFEGAVQSFVFNRQLIISDILRYP